MKTILNMAALLMLACINSPQVKAQSWSVTGNSGTSSTTNFLGTTDNVDLKIRTNNTVKATFSAGGEVGIGATPDGNIKLYSSFTKPPFTTTGTIYSAVKGRYLEGTIGSITHANGYLGVQYGSGAVITGYIPSDLNYIGVFGIKEDDNNFGAGVVGWNKNTNAGGTHYGMFGIANGTISGIQNVSDRNIGVYGSAKGNYNNIGLYGTAEGSAAWAGYFNGRAYVSDKLGVGVESPTASLHINCGSSVTPLKISVNTSVKMLLNASGNLALGHSTPSVRLHIKGTGELLRLDGTSSSIALYNSSVSKAFIQSDNGNLNLGTSTGNAAGNLYVYMNSSPKMTVLNNGNVGIGTTTPNAKLSIYGGGAAIDLIGTNNFIQFYNTSNVAKSYIQNSGNDLKIGISTGNTNGGVILNSSSGNLTLDKNGNVMINTSTPATGYKLSVNGKIICEELKVQLNGSWPDYVFENDYQLKSIDEVSAFIKTNKHLPNVPTAKEIEQSGISVGEMQTRMMEKIEELTLYVIQLKNQNDALKNQINARSGN